MAQEKSVEREYNGHPVITLNPSANFPFSFGPTKAELILENLDAIRAFAEKHRGKPTKKGD